ncbi:transmembrane receptors [Striga asiatica]|uniref:Transmembrane receptors n=1 Tax=Striga asiatica TaxID=4170 RepID=A0A5A7QU18_STRAF|nr:transmembrane receptors [Striga asiatica]
MKEMGTWPSPRMPFMNRLLRCAHPKTMPWITSPRSLPNLNVSRPRFPWLYPLPYPTYKNINNIGNWNKKLGIQININIYLQTLHLVEDGVLGVVHGPRHRDPTRLAVHPQQAACSVHVHKLLDLPRPDPQGNLEPIQLPWINLGLDIQAHIHQVEPAGYRGVQVVLRDFLDGLSGVVVLRGCGMECWASPWPTNSTRRNVDT